MPDDAKPRRVKPKKPAGSPLTPHACGQWCARIAGKLRYFGPWENHGEAERRYYETKAKIAGGQSVDRVVDSDAAAGATIGDLVDSYLTERERSVDAGELSRRAFDAYLATCRALSAEFGRGRRIATLTPGDFSQLRATLAAKLGPATLGGIIGRIKSVFRYGFEADVLDKPVRFGPTFKKPPQRTLREQRLARGPQLFTAEQIRLLLDSATTPMAAAILLGIGMGFGASDIATLPFGAIDFKAGWIDHPRPKTAMPRRCPLWPETAAALERVIAARPKPRYKADASIVFLTRRDRVRWVRYSDSGIVHDAVGEEFRRLAKPLGVPARFYTLRRTFRTVADEAGDQPAANVIMGHTPSADDMPSLYRQSVSDERLRKVADYVRAWLFPPKPARKKATKKAPRKRDK